MVETPNIVLIIADSLRKDAVGIYSGLGETPLIDAFAKDSVVYENCITPAPWTVPSHASFFTGKYSSEHGVHETYEKKLRDIFGEMMALDAETISEYLKKRGYGTLGFSANWLLSLHKGFERGFDLFNTIDQVNASDQEKELMRQAKAYGHRPSEVIRHLIIHGKFKELFELYSAYRRVRAAKKATRFPMIKGGDRLVKTIINSSLGQPFFVFANLIEMHDPYTKYEQNPVNKAGFTSVQMSDLYGVRKIPDETLQQIRRHYYSSTKYLDSFFGAIINYLKAKNIYDNSLIILTADHGQALKEKGYYGHGTFLYDELLEIPLIIKYPMGVKPPIRPKRYQSLVDIPHLIKSVIDGEAIEEVMNKEMVFSESFGVNNIPPPSLAKGDNAQDIAETRKKLDVPRKAIFKDGYKLVVNWNGGEVEEFTYHKKPLDPKVESKKLEELKNDLSNFIASVKPPTTRRETETMSLGAEEEADIADRLRALGYM